jgi:predicted metalloprotease
MGNRLWSAAAIVLLLAACGGPKPSGPASSAKAKPDTSAIQIHGDRSDPVNKLAIEAIADLQKYWSEQFPKLYDGKQYQPVKGGFFAVVPSSGDLPPCAQDASGISGNAFYCPSEDVVAWDAEGLLPSLKEKFSDFIIPVVLAHEWGHALQARSNFYAKTVTKETQADCFAGAWVKHAQDDKVFDVSSKDLDAAAAGLLDLRDVPGTEASDPSAHGSGFDRLGSFQNGYDNGGQACKGYRDGDPPVLELGSPRWRAPTTSPTRRRPTSVPTAWPAPTQPA